MMKFRAGAVLAALFCSVLFFDEGANAQFQITVGTQEFPDSSGTFYPTVTLENDFFTAFVGTQSGGLYGVESCIKSCVLKATGAQVVGAFMDASTPRGPLTNVVVTGNIDGSKTATMNFANGVVEYTLFQSQSYIKIRYVIGGGFFNMVDFSSTGGEYRVHGSAGWIRTIGESIYPCSYYNAYETGYTGCPSITYGPDPIDGGSLAYNGFFVLAFGQTGASGNGFGRVAPTFNTTTGGGFKIIKLFLQGGFEPFSVPFGPFTNYLFFFTNGVDSGLAYGKSIVAPVPVQLSSLNATVINSQGTVRVNWTTASETNNYGFEVQKSQSMVDGYETIPGAFLPGHGTTLVPHSYSYTDLSATPGIWYYRLKQIDLDGSIHFSDGVQASQPTDVTTGSVPTAFALSQNYPNPFNPSTTIKYELPGEANVTLAVFDVLGRKVADLVNTSKGAGYHSATWNASEMSSGVYFAHFTTTDANGKVQLSKVNKLLLSK